MVLNSQKLVRLSEKNLEETRRIIDNLKIHLREIKGRADGIRANEIKKKIEELSKKK